GRWTGAPRRSRRAGRARPPAPGRSPARSSGAGRRPPAGPPRSAAAAPRRAGPKPGRPGRRGTRRPRASPPRHRRRSGRVAPSVLEELLLLGLEGAVDLGLLLMGELVEGGLVALDLVL